MSRVIPLLAFVLAIGAVAVQGCSVPAQLEKLAGQIRPLCIDESGTTVDVVDGTCSGNFPDDPKLKAYIKCVAVMLDMVVRQNINFNIVIDMVPAASKARLTAAVNGCRDEGGDKVIDKLYNIVKCIYKADPDDFFMP